MTFLQSQLVRARARELFVLAAVVISVGCGVSNTTRESPEITTEYYGSFAGYHLPLKLVNRMSKEEALARAEELGASYYIARRDATGRLLEVTKIVRGKLFFRQEYTYDEAGFLTEVRSTKDDGRIFRKRYNSQGTLLTVQEEEPQE